MSNIRRDYEKSYSISKSSTNNGRENSKDDNERSQRKRRNSNLQRTSSNIDAKVYVGNVPTDNLTDGELLDFFKPFGKISDIRVYKGYIFVQYDRTEDANKLIKQGETSLILKGNKLDILPAMEASSTNIKVTLNDTSYRDYQNSERERQSSRNSRRYSDYDRHSSTYQPPRKRYPPKHHNDDHERHRSNFSINNQNYFGESNGMEIDDDRRIDLSSSRSYLRRLSRSPSRSNQSSYTILTGPDDPRQLVDCRIIIVNPRQRGYGEEMSSHLRCHGLVTSITLLREDYTLTEAIQNAKDDQCLYGIIAMPMHEERHTASFHILHGQTEEHRNLTLEDGYHIILTNYSSYKERIRNEELNNCHHQKSESIIYPSSINLPQHQEQTLTLNDKLPLSMLLCLLADGRQLTLDEIDRVLVYLLEKKSKMLTLPQGTLPPLPAQYATIKTGSSLLSSSTTTDSSSSSSELSSTIAEQIRQIFSTNLIKPSSLISTDDQSKQHQNCFQSISNLIPNEDRNKTNLNEGDTDLNHYQQKSQPSFSYSKSNSNSVAVVAPSFHYSSSSSSSMPTNGNSFLTQTFPSFDSINSPLKQTTSSTNFGCQSSQYLYPSTSTSTSTSIPTQNLYQTLPNSSAADAAAAIFQAYSQFNARTTPMLPILNQQTNTQHQQIPK